jgi:hypothetical protein
MASCYVVGFTLLMYEVLDIYNILSTAYERAWIPKAFVYTSQETSILLLVHVC